MRLTGDQKKKLKKIRNKISDFLKFFPHAGTVEENTWHFEVLLLFLSLRYGADLGRSRLVHIANEPWQIIDAITCMKLPPKTKSKCFSSQ